MSPKGTDLQRLYGILEVVDGTGWRGEVEYEVDPVLEIEIFRNIMLHEGVPGIPLVVGDVPHISGDKVVHRDNPVPLLKKKVAEV